MTEKKEKVEIVKRADNGDMLIPTSEMLKIFGFTQDTLNEWAKRGCPKHSRGYWSLKDVIRWRGMGKVGEANHEQSNEAKKLQADADYKHAKARQEEVRLQEMLGELVPIEMIRDKLSMTFTEIRQTLLKLPSDLRVAIHTQYPEASEGVTEIAEETVRKCLSELASCSDARVNATMERADRSEHSGSEDTVQPTEETIS